GGRPHSGGERRRRRIARSQRIGRAASLRAVSPARRARLSQPGLARPVLVFARAGRANAAQFFPGRSRSHGRERKDHGHLRILQFDLHVRAAGRARADAVIVTCVPQNGVIRAYPRRPVRSAATWPPCGPQLIVRSRCGVSSEKAGILMSNSSPAAVTMPEVPVMKPDEVGNGTPLVYSKFSPGLSTGSSPTTPAPRTSCRRPCASVMRQWRVLSWTVSPPRLVSVMV